MGNGASIVNTNLKGFVEDEFSRVRPATRQLLSPNPPIRPALTLFC